MAEKFKYDINGTNGSDRVSWLFITAVSGLGLDHPFFSNTSADGEFMVEMKVDGHEVPFSRTMSRLDEIFEQCVESRAKELLRERAVELLAKLTDLQDHVNREVDRLFPSASDD